MTLSEYYKAPDPLPPFSGKSTILIHLEPGVTVLRQMFSLGVSLPGLDSQIFLNCFVIRLKDGSLAVISPISLTQDVESLFDSIEGEVRHIIIPNTSPEHGAYAPQAARKWPTATIWVCPGEKAIVSDSKQGHSCTMSATCVR